MDWLKGKKTYLLAALYAVITLIEFVSAGDFSWPALVAFFQTETIAGLATTIRAGISKRPTT